jgi:hypothetical protein
MRARSAERAQALWSTVLQGRGQQVDGPLVYRWPGSPMRIAVDVDADAEEGPVAVEYASLRAVSLPSTPHPALGTVFRSGPA